MRYEVAVPDLIRTFGYRHPCLFMPSNPADVEAAVAVLITSAARDQGWQPTSAAVIDFRWVELDDGSVECRAKLPVVPAEGAA